MKLVTRYLLSFCMILFISNKCRSQDIITFLNGEKKEVKVLEVFQDDIKCRAYDTLIKRIFYYNRKDIFIIAFEGGRTDTLNKISKPDSAITNTDKSQQFKIVREDKILYRQNQRISNAEALELIYDRAHATHDSTLQSHIDNYKGYRKKVIVFAISGSVLAGIAPGSIITAVVQNWRNQTDANAGYVIGAVALTAGIVSFVKVGEYFKQRRKYFYLTIDAYNNTYN